MSVQSGRIPFNLLHAQQVFECVYIKLGALEAPLLFVGLRVGKVNMEIMVSKNNTWATIEKFPSRKTGDPGYFKILIRLKSGKVKIYTLSGEQDHLFYLIEEKNRGQFDLYVA